MSLMRPSRIENHHGEHLGRAKWILFCEQKWGFSDSSPYFARQWRLSREPPNGFHNLNKFGLSKTEWNQFDEVEMIIFPFWPQTCSLPPFQLPSSTSLSKISVTCICIFLTASSASYLVVWVDVQSSGR